MWRSRPGRSRLIRGKSKWAATGGTRLPYRGFISTSASRTRTTGWRGRSWCRRRTNRAQRSEVRGQKKTRAASSRDELLVGGGGAGAIGGTFYRQGYFKRASLLTGADQADGAAELGGEISADGQAHAKAFAAIALGVVDLVELVEQVGGVFAGDADTGVGDTQRELFIAADQAEGHAAGAGVFHGVIDEIGDEALELLAIAT